MKLTRKQLNRALLSLPNPKLVLNGDVPPFIKVPIMPDLLPVFDDELPPMTTRFIELTFEFSMDEMDWFLSKEL